MGYYDLEQLVDKPTRLTDSLQTILDMIFTNKVGKVRAIRFSPISLSESYPLRLCLNIM